MIHTDAGITGYGYTGTTLVVDGGASIGF